MAGLHSKRGAAGLPNGVTQPGYAPHCMQPAYIAGVGKVGNILTRVHGLWAGSSTITIAWQWTLGGADISGATGDALSIDPSYAGQALGGYEKATNGAGGPITQAASNTKGPIVAGSAPLFNWLGLTGFAPVHGSGSSGAVSGTLAGSTLSVSGVAGLTITGTNWAFDGSASAGTVTAIITESLYGFTNNTTLSFVVTAGAPGLAQPSITETSPPGTNPPTWDLSAPDLENGDTIELYYTTDGSTPVVGTPQETHIVDAREETINWTTWPSSFANGATVKWMQRYGRMVAGTMEWSNITNIISDTMPMPANVTAINRGIFAFNLGYGTGPAVQNNIAVGGHSKIVLSIGFIPNGSSITAITANSGAITFTRATATAASAVEQVWYADIGAVTNLSDLTIDVSASTHGIDVSVDELSNAAAGGPSAVYAASIAAGNNTTPVEIDGSLTIPTNGIGIYSTVGNSATPVVAGATLEASGPSDVNVDWQSTSYSLTTGAVSVEAYSYETIKVINSAWAHA